MVVVFDLFPAEDAVPVLQAIYRGVQLLLPVSALIPMQRPMAVVLAFPVWVVHACDIEPVQLNDNIRHRQDLHDQPDQVYHGLQQLVCCWRQPAFLPVPV